MWLRRVAAAGLLRARVAPRMLKAALSTSHYVAQAQATIPTFSVRRESDKQQQKAHGNPSLEADMNAARHLLREKFDIHPITPEQETLLYRLLTGQDVFLQIARGPSRIAFQLVSVSVLKIATNMTHGWSSFR